MTCKSCRDLLSEGLDLCVRARNLDAQERTSIAVDMGVTDIDRYVARQNALHPDQPHATRSGTIPMWVQAQYETDLAVWEGKSRTHLQQGCTP